MLASTAHCCSRSDMLPNTPPPPKINTGLRRQSIITVLNEAEVKSCTNQSVHRKDIHRIQSSDRTPAPFNHTSWPSSPCRTYLLQCFIQSSARPFTLRCCALVVKACWWHARWHGSALLLDAAPIGLVLCDPCCMCTPLNTPHPWRTLYVLRARCVPPPPCISYANVRNYYGPYAHCSLDKGVACAKHIQLPTQTCARAWYGCTLTSAHISKCMQTQDSLGNMKFSGSHPCWHKQ